MRLDFLLLVIFFTLITVKRENQMNSTLNVRVTSNLQKNIADATDYALLDEMLKYWLSVRARKA